MKTSKMPLENAIDALKQIRLICECNKATINDDWAANLLAEIQTISEIILEKEIQARGEA